MKPTARAVIALGCIALLVFGGLLRPTEGSSGPARISLNDGHNFLPLFKPDPVTLKIDVTANEWLNQKVETYARVSAFGEGGSELLYFSDGQWKRFSNSSELKPFGSLDLTSDVFPFQWTAFNDTSELPYSSMSLTFSLDKKVDGTYSFGDSVSDEVTVGLGSAEVLTPATVSGTLRAASVKTGEGLCVGVAMADHTATQNSVEFDLPAGSGQGMLLIAGLDTIDGFTNPNLEGVRVSLIERGRINATINNGQIDTSGLFFSFNGDLLNPSQAYLNAFRALAAQMGIPEGTPVPQAIEKLRDLEAAIQTVDPAVMKSVLEEMDNYGQQLAQVINAPVPTVRKPGSTPVLAIVNAFDGEYRVQVSAEPSAESFGLVAAYVPPYSSPFTYGTTGFEQADFRVRSILRAEELLRQELSKTSINDSTNTLAAAQPSDPCQEYQDSYWNKLVTNLIITAGTAAIGRIVGAAAGAAGVAGPTATQVGGGVGTVAGLLAGAAEWLDFTKKAIRFLIAEKWPSLDHVTLRLAASVVCQGKSTDVLVGFFNRCGGPLFGTGLLPLSSDDAAVRVVPPQLGRLTYEGFGLGIGNVWGTGAKYKFHAEVPGKGSIEVSVPTADGLLTKSLPIEVKKCGTQNVQLWQLR